MPSNLNKEKAKRNLETIIDRLHNDTDFSLLKEYKKIYRSKIFFLSRSDVAAWLFMYYDQKETPRARSVEKPLAPRDNQRSAKPAVEEKTSSPAQPEINLSEDESKRLFISIGKNRRLYPREVITLIMSKTSAVREDIGAIRILDNYSFVQVRDNKADEIIAALTGTRFRGRTLSVNYAKPKNSETENDSENR